MTERAAFRWKVRGGTLTLGARTVLMGIINVTPDSFSGDGVLKGKAVTARAVKAALLMVKNGAAIIDVGGESTRPGALPVTVDAEIARVVPVVKALVGKSRVLISVDTVKPEVAAAALAAGAHIVNLVQGTPVSTAMIDVVRRYKAGLVLMHMRGTPATMQSLTDYDDVVRDVVRELARSVARCVRAGIPKAAIAVDPGIGFAKTVAQNLALIKGLRSFKRIGCPVLVGPSRKSFIGKVLGIADPAARRWGTAAAVSAAVMNGAHIVRVHDVDEMRQVAGIIDAVLQGGKNEF